MKKLIYLFTVLAAVLSVSTHAVAQKRITDMSVKVTSPGNGDTMRPHVSTNVTIDFTNLGPDKLVEGDTILFMTSLNAYTTIGGFILDSDLHAGETISHFIDVISNNGTATENIAFPVCIKILNPNTMSITLGGVPFHVTYNDPDTVNNFDCDTAILTGSAPTAIASIAGLAISPMSIYPNPVLGQETYLSISLEAAAQVTISLTNISGQVVLQQDAGVLTAGNHKDIVLNTAGLPNGLYMATVQVGDKTLHQKLSLVR